MNLSFIKSLYSILAFLVLESTLGIDLQLDLGVSANDELDFMFGRLKVTDLALLIFN